MNLQRVPAAQELRPELARRGRLLSRPAQLVLLFLTVLLGGAFAGCAQEASIMDIQGRGHLSPYDGQMVITEGVVTAVAFNGFYMQDPVGDDDHTTSDGIFVFTGSNPGPEVEVGDYVSVNGTVSEFIPGGASTGNLSTTQLSGDVEIVSSNFPVPAPVEIGPAGLLASGTTVISDSELPTNLQTDPAEFNPFEDAIDFWEALEGMYVEVDEPKATSGVRQFSPFSSEVFTLPSEGTVAQPLSARTPRGGILLQPDPDNTGDQNPERVQIQFDGTLFPEDVPSITVGDQLSDVRGVVGYSFGNFEVNATDGFRIYPSGLQAESTDLVGDAGNVTVASYNVLNLSPLASDDAQRDKVAEQIVDRLGSPDVVALQEIQDNNGDDGDDGTVDADQTLKALVDAISAAGGPAYEFFDVAPADGANGGIPGGNIRNAYLYNADRVELVDFELLTPGVLADYGVSDPSAFVGTREPLAAQFSFDGDQFLVINNHLTSRFGSTPIFGGPQPFVQAGEAEREAQVGALNEVVDAILADAPDAPIMVLGDINTFEWTNDLAEILPGPEPVLTNLLTQPALNRADRDNRYTFIFDGNSQALDHFFVTDNLNRRSTELDIVHVNVDFPRLSSSVVASDHEPLVGRFSIPSTDDFEPFPESGPYTLQVLHASDLEGGVDALDRAANFAAIVDQVEDYADVDGSVTLSAGDNYIPGPFFNAAADRATFRDGGVFNDFYNDLFGTSGDVYAGLREEGGRADISIMNAIGFDASALGNHEFDAGTDAVEQIIEEDFRGAGLADDRWVGAQFPYLSANLDFSDDGAMGDLFTSSLLPNTAFASGPAESAAGDGNIPKIAPATFIEVGGERIGVVGATTQLLASISSPGSTTVIGGGSNDMAQLATLIQPQIDALAAAGSDKIVLVSHLQQLALERELAGLLSGVDIIIAGGSDSLLANADDPLRSGDTADEAYPVLETSAAGDPVAIVSTDGEYSYVGRLVVTFDADGKLIGNDDAPLTAISQLDLAVNGPIKTEDADVAALWGSVAASQASGTKAELVQRIVDAVQGVVTAKDGNVVGESSVYLDGRRESVRTEETNFGNLTADANLAAAQAFDSSVVLSLKNGGGIRAPIGEVDASGNFLAPQANPLSGKLDGQISQLDIENSLRFNNGLSLLTLTATELQAVFEHAVAETAPGATPGRFPQIGGVQFSFDASLAAGSRVQTLEIVDSSGTVVDTVISGGAIQGDATRTFRIVTLNFLAGGGDGYPFPTDASANRIDLEDVLTDAGDATFADAGSEQDALAEFLIANHPVGGTTPFSAAETDPGDDTRIVSLP
jgi:2',3'-cyclic-nucleotide 2'-phosphodiesterase (5'-nucleotidase family)